MLKIIGTLICIYLSTLIKAPLALAAVSELNPISGDPASATYTDVRTFMHQLAALYPKTTQIFSLGSSDSGDTIEGLAIGNGSINNLVVSTHHGNEYGATEVARAFAASIAKDPIQGQTIYVIPVLNIGGYNQKNRRESAKNDSLGGDHDPNRDYPGPCGTEGPHKLQDTSALAQFVATRNIVTSATLHTFYPAVVYPWGLATQDLSTPYDDLFKGLVQQATIESQYQTGNSTEVIYAANGTYEDYAFWKHGIWSILFELGDTHTPDLPQVQEWVKVNVPGIRRMMEHSPTQRAENHAFTGKCDGGLLSLDRHDE